jgi:hypothetical protein
VQGQVLEADGRNSVDRVRADVASRPAGELDRAAQFAQQTGERGAKDDQPCNGEHSDQCDDQSVLN